MDYRAPYGSPDPDASYVDKDVPGAVAGSKVPAKAIENPQRELVALIEGSGITPSVDVLNQVAQAVRSQRLNYVFAGGSANALTATLSPALLAYTPGLTLRVLIATANTGAATLNVNGLGARPIVSMGAALQGGEMPAGVVVVLTYDGTSWHIVSAAQDLITTEIMKTIGPGGDFANLQASANWVSRYRIAQTGGVTFTFTAGQHIINDDVTLSHPDSDRIRYYGTGSPSVPTLTVTAYTGGTKTTEIAAQLTALRAAYSTELRLTAGAAITSTGAGVTFAKLLVTGDGSQASGEALLMMFAAGLLDRVSFHGSGGAGLIAHNARVQLLTFVSATGCGGAGMIASNGGVLTQIGDMILNSNGGDGLLAYTGMMQRGGGSFTARGNGGHGVSALFGDVDLAGASAVASVNGSYGINASYGSAVRASSSTTAGNGSGGLAAGSGSVIGATGATIQSAFPTVNTVGNNNALIFS